MRIERTTQTSLFDPSAVDHPVARELERASAWLEAVRADLDGGAESGRGRHGLSCETVLRCAVLLHLRQTSYRGLAFELADSLSARRFARLDPSRAAPGKSALQAGIGSIGAGTWERIGRGLLEAARTAGVETGATVRVDSTVTETHILEPSDSGLLYDGVRVLTRLLHRAPSTSCRGDTAPGAVSPPRRTSRSFCGSSSPVGATKCSESCTWIRATA